MKNRIFQKDLEVAEIKWSNKKPKIRKSAFVSYTGRDEELTSQGKDVRMTKDLRNLSLKGIQVKTLSSQQPHYLIIFYFLRPSQKRFRNLKTSIFSIIKKYNCSFLQDFHKLVSRFQYYISYARKCITKFETGQRKKARALQITAGGIWVLDGILDFWLSENATDLSLAQYRRACFAKNRTRKTLIY